MIGDGPLMDRCRALVEERGLATQVRLHGMQPSNVVARFMAEASLFVQHSVVAPNGDTEGFGISLVEAMTSEVPLVVTRHNGFVEIVHDGETGLLVDEHDVSGMAEAMATLLGDPDRARAMGEAGRRRVLANFTHDHTRDRLRAIMGFPPFTGTATTLETTESNQKNLMSAIVTLARIECAAAPTATSDEVIRLAVIKRLSWINPHYAALRQRLRQRKPA